MAETITAFAPGSTEGAGGSSRNRPTVAPARADRLRTPTNQEDPMKTTGIRGWRDVMRVACPPDRPPTPTIPRGAAATLAGLDGGPSRAAGAAR